jgi:ureidoglycolate dehydrogenase (NAD+)
MARISSEALTSLIADLFIAKGLGEEKALQIAAPLVEASERGVASHGAMRALHYLKRAELGGAELFAEVTTESESAVSAVLDAHAGLGMPVSYRAVELARDKAARHGFGCVLVRNSNHYGAAAFWAQMLAGDDMIGVTCTNTEPGMAAPGARRATVGNSPFSIAIPAGEHPAVCLDMATSEAAFGKILDRKARGLPIPSGWAVDADGAPTTDPDKAATLLPFGMHKGYGIAVIIDIVTGILAGGAYGFGVRSIYGQPELPQEISHFFLAMRLDLFRDPAAFKEDVDRYIDAVHAVPAAGGMAVRVPGEIEEEKRRISLREGIELPDQVAKDLEAAAAALGIDCQGCFFYEGKPGNHEEGIP